MQTLRAKDQDPGGLVPKQNGSWLGLVGFSAMWSLAIAVALAVLIAGATLAFAISLP
jgi:hypothetical protein